MNKVELLGYYKLSAEEVSKLSPEKLEEIRQAYRKFNTLDNTPEYEDRIIRIILKGITEQKITITEDVITRSSRELFKYLLPESKLELFGNKNISENEIASELRKYKNAE